MPRILLALALCVACKKTPPAPARFCDQDLTGLWLNSSDTRLAYRFRDHGEVVRGEFLERQPDGGLQAPDDPILFELHRTDAGLGGVMRAQGPSPSGRICPVEYGTCVSEFKPDALTWVVVGDLKQTEAPVRALNLGPVTVLDADGKPVK